jgi:hypothetical protein
MTKLSQYIREASRETILDPYEAAKILKKECRQYINEAGKSVFDLYRGVDNAPRIAKFYMMKKFAHTEKRTPRDTLKKIHKYFNNKFEDIFGWPVRNGVFVTGSKDNAESYGRAFLFFPAGKYEYVWSPKIQDLTGHFEEPEDEPGLSVEYMLMHTEKDIDKILDTYIDTDLKRAIRSKSEISFNCEYYYIINTDIDYPTDDFIEFEKMILK